MTVKSNRRYWSAYALGAATTLIAGALWLGLASPPRAYAQIPDSGAQRNRMIHELASANKKLAEIADVLKEIRDQGKGESPSKQRRGPAGTRP